MKNLAKKILSTNLFLNLGESRRFIFVYHDISDENESHFSGKQYSTTVENFKRQIAFLSRKFEFVPLDALVTDNNLSRKKHYASIVFDDGFASVTKTARPILDAAQIPFAIFVNKAAILFNQLWVSNLILYKNDEAYFQRLFKWLNDSSISYPEFAAAAFETLHERAIFDDRFRQIYLYPAKESERKIYLDAEEVKSLHDEGILIGSHSTDHYPLNKCTEMELSAQINGNKDFLEDLLTTKIKHFAIPFGRKEDYGKNVIEKLFAVGHKFVHSTNIIPFKSKETALPGFLFPRLVILNNSLEEIMFYINRTFLRKYDL